MENAINKFVEYYEERYKEGIERYKIEEVTGVSYNKFSSIFKEVAGIKLKTYMKRRALTKIVNDIKENNEVFMNNVLPYSTPQAFSEAFKSEFHISPRRFLDIKNEIVLCEKIDVRTLYSEYEENQLILNDLIEEYLGYKKRALNFLLSLNAYSITTWDENFSHELGLGYKLLNRRFIDEEGGGIFTYRSISVDRYLDEAKILPVYYDLQTYITFPTVSQYSLFSERKYFIVKRQIINKLISNCDIKTMINISNLKTIFLHFKNMTKFRALEEIEKIMLFNYYYQNGKKVSLNKLERLSLKYISLQDIGIKKYNNINDLINNLQKETKIDVKTLNKTILKLIKSGLLYLDEIDHLDYEKKMKEKMLQEYKQHIRIVEQEGKEFLKLLRKIKKYIIEIRKEGEVTKVKYSYKAIKLFKEIKDGYSFAYMTKNVHGAVNIYTGSSMDSNYLELSFNLSYGKLDKFDKKVKDNFNKKIKELLKVICKEGQDEK